MFSATRLLGGLLSHGLGRTVRGSSGSMLGTAATVAGIAAAGGLAYGAYRLYQSSRGESVASASSPSQAPVGGGWAQPAPQPGGWASGLVGTSGAFTTAQAAGFGAPAAAAGPSGREEEDALLLVRAMIAAANVDGRIDDAERQRIADAAARAGLGAAERQALERELAAPQPPYALLGKVRDAELAAQLYLVTLLAVDRDDEAERTYVRALPLVLALSAERVARIHAELGVSP